ncbi:MAG: hypothetical protein M1825_004174 [Sarcosagium campestre]|nr:MAG: hypothetical protein M1825_004174 [Sarcosagium campestre]
MDTEDGQAFIKHLAYFVRTHEKALANALQQRLISKNGQTPISSGLHRSATQPLGSGATSYSASTAQPKSSMAPSSSSLVAALSLSSFGFGSSKMKPAKLSLTPHHLFYLLSRFEELGISVGPMNVRVEDIHTDASPANYVSFLSQSQRSKTRASDRDSIHSVSSVRSVMSGMHSFWSSFGLGSSSAPGKNDKSKVVVDADLKYLYSSFTKIPSLKLAPDRKARLIAGYEEFPFDAAVPLWSFKNLSTLEICDIDIRQFFGWDRLADQLRSLTVRRAGVENPMDLLISIVLDDMDKRRRRSSKTQPSPIIAWAPPNAINPGDSARSNSAPGSPKAAPDKLAQSSSPQSSAMARGGSEGSGFHPRLPPRSISPAHRSPPRPQGHQRSGARRVHRSGSASSQSSRDSSVLFHSGSSSNLLGLGLPPSKWRFLRHLSLADNSLTSITAASIAPLANTLHSLDLSANHLAEIPDCLATLTSLRALNLSNCMIDSLHSLARNPLPAITALNLRANRLFSIAGIERLPSLERLDLRENKLHDPTELARLTGIPDIREIWVAANPFTRSHSNYRVTIFNLFRSTPGYTEDILLDSAGPSYAERKRLVDRAEEPPNIPVIKVPPPDDSPVPTPQPPSATVQGVASLPPAPVESLSRPVARSTQSETFQSPNRRPKGNRRRIVELSRDQSVLDSISPKSTPLASPRPNERSAAPPIPLGASVDRDAKRQISEHAPPDLDGSGHPQPQTLPRLNTVMAPSVQAGLTRAGSRDAPQDWNVSGEIYKKKIEALRSEVGNGWLSVLGEDGWDGQKVRSITTPTGDFSPASTIRPSPTTPRAGSTSIISGSRTLG